MKIKLTQPGYENMTGLLGALHFTNGVSEESVSRHTAAGIANIVQCELIDDASDAVADDVTDPTINETDTTGDFDAATAPAPVDPA